MKLNNYGSRSRLCIVLSLVVLSVFAYMPYVQAATGSVPVASIGTGNGNTPSNTGPTDLGVYNGTLAVYATITDEDNDLDTYHFRVIKEGGSEGDTCSWTDTLSNTENQGYASSTLGKSACGFVFNQSVLMSATGFTNSVIATLNTADLSAFAGDGKYILILGARDFARNRSQQDYLQDTRVSIIVNSNATTTTSTPTPETPSNTDGTNNSSGNGETTSPGTTTGGGRSGTRHTVSTVSSSNGQVAGASTSVNTPGVTSGGSGAQLTGSTGSISSNGSVEGATDITILNDETMSSSTDEMLSTSTGTSTETDSRFEFNWKWIIAIILVIIAGFLIYRSTRERN